MHVWMVLHQSYYEVKPTEVFLSRYSQNRYHAVTFLRISSHHLSNLILFVSFSSMEAAHRDDVSLTL